MSVRELILRAFTWLIDGKTQKRITNKYGRDLEKLWRHSKARGISKYVSPTPLREGTLNLLILKRLALGDLHAWG